MLPVVNFIDFIERNNLFKQGSKILAAVSGGMDSVLMVHLLKSAGFDIGIAHCNFQLRGENSESDQQFCNGLAQQLKVPFHSICFDTVKYASDNKISVQMAARGLRYQWFEQIRQQYGYSFIALAHHQNDAIETILLNLIRGTGIAGLHGILPKSGLLVRPLLFLTRDQIEGIINENELTYVEDSSNSSVKYARNKLRLKVIPLLKELNPGLEHTFEKNLEHFRNLELLLNQRLVDLKASIFIAHNNEFDLPIAALKNLVPQRLLLFKLLQEYGVNETIIDGLILALNKHPGKIFETAEYRLILDRDKLIISKKEEHLIEPVLIYENVQAVKYARFQLTILHDDSPLIVKDNLMATAIDTDLLVYPLMMRPWVQGDYFYPLGMNNRKKLSDFFIGQKIPRHHKNDVPLLINGNGDIIWVGGYRLDERYKVTGDTKKVTIFELFKNSN